MHVSITFLVLQIIFKYLIKKVLYAMMHGRQDLKETFYTFKKDGQSAQSLYSFLELCLFFPGML